MGRSMAGHLLDAGHEVVLHTRTKSKASALLARGATWASTPAAAADGADAAFSMVGMPDEVEMVHLSGEGTLAARTPPRVVVDMGTSPPSLARRIAHRAREVGVGSVDAPVSGGDIGARNAALSIMVGGEESDVAAAMPLLEKLGRTIVHHGPPGSGQHCKLVNQILVAAATISMCEALTYAHGAELDADKVLRSVGGGAAGSWTIEHLAPRVLRGDLAPGFMAEHLAKDLAIAIDEAKEMSLELPGLLLAKRLFDDLVAKGYGARGTHAMILHYRPDLAKSMPEST
ncbi:MAG: NAD(P)-dependent oxidoreductase [Phycisphaeraceae bacterium]|nr:NAD(P)-dependent oxidoreductase [Phycisphaeraceae bacterium]